MSFIAAVRLRNTDPEPGVLARLGAEDGEQVLSGRLGRSALAVGRAEHPIESDLVNRQGLMVGFVGMLDNRDELLALLRSEGQEPALQGPAGVLLALHRSYGDAAPSLLRGVFGAVIADGDRMWFFRDQIGFWPLFYHVDGRAGIAASSIKKVVEVAGLPYEPDIEIAERVFFRNLGDERRCAIRGVERLPPATCAEIGEDAFELRTYWRPEELLETRRPTSTEVVEGFEEYMTTAVRRSLKGNDVVSLSGGIDSPAVAAYAAPLSRSRFGEPIGALSAVYPDHPAVDERDYIIEVADYLQIPYHLYETRARPTDGLTDWVRRLDGPVPIISLSETLEHLRKARSLGYRNMLTGELAEFVFDMNNDVLTHLVMHGRFRPALRHVRSLKQADFTNRQVARRVAGKLVPAWLRSLRDQRQKRVRTEVSPAPWLDRSRLGRQAPLPLRDRWRWDQLAPFGGPALAFEAEHIIQQMTGVWVRLPWADIDLWEFFLSMRAEIKHPDPWRKSLVRDLITGKVPDSIVRRQSRTFFDDSLMGKIDYPLLRELLVDPNYRVDGVDYQALAEELEAEKLTLPGFMWAKDLAGVHAFLAQF